MTPPDRIPKAGLRRRTGRGVVRWVARRVFMPVLLLVCLAVDPGSGSLGPSALAAETIGTARDGVGRMVFRWEEPVRYTVEIRAGALVARFDAPLPADVALMPERLPNYINSVRLSQDRRQVVMPLKGDFGLRVFTLGSGVVVDLEGGPPLEPATPSPEPAATEGAVPDVGPDVGPVGVRTGEHQGFQRLVFDWPQSVPFTLETEGRRAVLRFAEDRALDLSRIRDRLPEGFGAVSQAAAENGRTVTVVMPAGATAQAFTSGPKVVLDVRYDADAVATAETEPPAADDGEEPNVEVDGAATVEDPGAQEDAQQPAPTAAQTETEADAEADAETPAPEPAPESAPEDGLAGSETVLADLLEGDAPDDGTAPPSETVTAAAPASDAASDQPAAPDAAASATEPDAPAQTPETQPNVAAVASVVGASGPALTPGSEQAMADRLAEAIRDSAEQDPDPDRPAVVSLGFSWDKPTAAAVFRRAGYLWVVFDRFQEVDLRLLRRAGAGVVRTAEQVRMDPDSTLVRMTTAPGYNPSLRRDGLLWVLDLMQRPLRPERPIEVRPQIKSPVGPRVLIPVVEGGRIIPLRDPELGDQVFILPLVQLGHGIYPARRFPEISLPVTAQGVVVVPHSDRIEMRASRNGAEVAAEGGLILSEENTRLETLATLGTGALKQIFDIPGWRRADLEQPVHTIKNTLMYAVSMAPPSRRGEARLELARFLFANGYAPEALGVLETIAAEQPDMINTAAFRALRGATRFLMGRDGEAVDDLSHPSLVDVDEAAFWRAAAQSRLGQAGLQAAVLAATGAILENYPPDVRIPLALVAADAAIRAGDDLSANTFLEVARDPEYNTLHDLARIKVLEGDLMASTGAFEAAIAAWKDAELSPSRRNAALARRARLDMEHRLNLIDTEQLINGLESLRFAWRGGEFEYELLRELGALYLEEQRYGDALRTLRLAASYFENRPGAEDLTETMRAVFDTLFLEGAANDMSPLKAIALFDEFRELTPTGDRGDEMIRRLADRLVSVDLLDPAAALLERQIRYRLRGINRTKVGARLALVYLLNRQPLNALEGLDKTRFAPLPEALERQRRHLRARALADSGETAAGLALLENDPSEDARVLRAEINWRNQNWAAAARALAELVPPPPDEGTPMAEKDAFRLIDWATALTLAGDETAVSLLRQRYMDALTETPFENAFDLVTASPEAGLIDVASVGGKIRQAERFRNYLTAYRERLREERLSAIN